MPTRHLINKPAGDRVLCTDNMKAEDVETDVSLTPTKLVASDDSKAKKPGRIDEVHSVPFTAFVGGSLCLVSGWVNAVAFLGFGGGVTHVTGTSTKIGWFLAHEEYTMFLECLGKVFLFMVGSIISGAYLGGARTFKGGPRYAHLLFGVSGLMYASFGAAQSNNVFTGALLLAMSSGMQNAMTTMYSSAVVRTTHVTGTITDIGVEIGKMLFRGDMKSLWKVKLHTTFWFTYGFGGFLGAEMFEHTEREAILVPASIVMAMAIGYMLALCKAVPVKGSKNGYGLHADTGTIQCCVDCYGDPADEEDEERKDVEVVPRTMVDSKTPV